MICFDMDGTIANLYAVDNWLADLRNQDTRPYEQADFMWDIVELNTALLEAKRKGHEIVIITWASKDSDKEFDKRTANVKKQWLVNHGFNFDRFHCVKYGTTKANSIRKYAPKDEECILIDDNAEVRKGWHLGRTIDPATENIIERILEL